MKVEFYGLVLEPLLQLYVRTIVILIAIHLFLSLLGLQRLVHVVQTVLGVLTIRVPLVLLRLLMIVLWRLAILISEMGLYVVILLVLVLVAAVMYRMVFVIMG
jgi:hypothetical protein